jgi:hypothetical protein
MGSDIYDEEKVEFYNIAGSDRVAEGEYIYHVPSNTIVLCGFFSRNLNKITALSNGRLLDDEIDNFQKIKMPQKEAYRTRAVARCGGCKKA